MSQAATIQQVVSHNPHIQGSQVQLSLADTISLPALAQLAYIHRAALAPTLSWVKVTDTLPDITAKLAPHIEKLHSHPQPLTSILWTISAGPNLVGMLNIQPKSQNPLSVDIGYWIAPPHHNQGHATQALLSACHYLTQHFPAIEILIRTYTTNLTSIAVAQKAGFVLQSQSTLRPAVSVFKYILPRPRS